MTEEQYLHQMLSELRRNYDRAAAPIIRRLAYLRSIGLIRITLTFDEAERPDFVKTEQDTKP
jgi:hypothetical protein